MVVLLLAAVLGLAVVSLYRYVTQQYGRWERLGVPCISGTFPFGSHSDNFLHKKHMKAIVLEDYKRFQGEDYYGTYLLGKPVLNIVNTDLIQTILVKHFGSFSDRINDNIRRVFDGGELDQLWKNQMTNLCGDSWKQIRTSFSPIFTAGRLKNMFRFIQAVVCRLKEELGRHSDSGEEFELKAVFGKFSLDSLAHCAFGLNPNSFQDAQSSFQKYADNIFTNSRWDYVLGISRYIPGIQELHKAMKMNVIKPEATLFFRNVISRTIHHRRESGIRENDFIDLMVDCIVKDFKEVGGDERNRRLSTEDNVVATAILMLVAGYDTTAMTLSYLAYYLGEHPDIQETLQQEIDQAYKDKEREGLVPDYETLQSLPYLEACIKETLRLQSPQGTITRCCTKDLTLPNTNLTIRKNDLVLIPVVAVHMDERHYPDPTVFNPENFHGKPKNTSTFLAFGGGPRACIGQRFALMEAKMAMMEVLREFTFVSSHRNLGSLVPDPHSQLGYVKGGLHARISRRIVEKS